MQPRDIPAPVADHLQERPSASDTYAVWTEKPAANPLLAIHLGTGKLIFVSNPACQSQDAATPAISGSLVVWLARASSNNANDYLCATDLATGTNFVIASGPAYPYSPAIDGSTVVWGEFDDTGRWFKTKDLVTGKVTTIRTVSLEITLDTPLVNSDYIAWSEYTVFSEGGPQYQYEDVKLHLLDRKSGSTRIAAQFRNEGNGRPDYALADRYLAFYHINEDTLHVPEVRVVDLSTGKIAHYVAAGAYGLSAHGHYLVWSDYAVPHSSGCDGPSAKGMDLNDGSIVTLVPCVQGAFGAEISGDWLVWQSPYPHDSRVHLEPLVDLFRTAQKP